MSTTIETAVDPVPLAIQQLADIVASNAAWQESVSAYSDDEAREYIFKVCHQPDNQQIERPFAIIFALPGTSWERRADGVMMPRGQLFLHLGRPEGSNDNELEERAFDNWAGLITNQISNYRGPGYRMRTTQTDPPAYTAPQDRPAQKAYRDCGYTVDWDCYG